MKYAKMLLVISASLGTLLGFTVAAHAQSAVSSCGVKLSAPGDYVLASDLDCSGTNATAISITSSNITLHLANHTLSSQDCNLDVEDYGINVMGGLSGVRIDGGTVRGFTDGIVLASSHSLVSGVTVTGACTFGVALQGDHNRLFSSLITANLVYGVGLQVSQFQVVAGNEISDNGSGIGFANQCKHNLVLNNRIVGNRHTGILLDDSTKTLVRDNEISGNVDGIELFDTDNTIQHNIVNANLSVGIYDATTGPNFIKRNAAFGNAAADMEDVATGCGSTLWTANAFVTDLVDAASDGGPKSGCIR